MKLLSSLSSCLESQIVERKFGSGEGMGTQIGRCREQREIYKEATKLTEVASLSESTNFPTLHSYLNSYNQLENSPVDSLGFQLTV